MLQAIIDWLLDFGNPTAIAIRLLAAAILLVSAGVGFWLMVRYWLKRIKKLAKKPEPNVNQSGSGNVQAQSSGNGSAFSALGPGAVQGTGSITVNQGVPFSDLPNLLHDMSDPTVSRLEEIAASLTAHASDRSEADRLRLENDQLRKQVEEAVAAVAAVKELAKARDALNKLPVQAGLEDAKRKMDAGDTSGAEAIFEQVLADKKQEGESAFKEAAAAARHLGALAFLHDTHKALGYYRKAADLDPEDAEAWNRLGQLLFRLGDLDKAREALEKVLALGNRSADKALIAMATGNLGPIYLTQGDFAKAEEHFLKALALANELGNKEDMAALYGNLGLIYRTQGELSKAEAHHLKALALNQELGRKEGKAAEYSNLGLIYQTQGDLAKAEAHHLKSLEIAKELGNKEYMAALYGNLGLIYRTQGALAKADEHHQNALALNRELGHKQGMAIQYNNLGVLETERGDKDKACAYYRQALDLFTQVGMPREIEQTKQNMAALGCPDSSLSN